MTLEQDKPFGEVAKEFSDDASNAVEGDMGFVKKEELIPELREAVKLLIPGTYSNVVRTPFGYPYPQADRGKERPGRFL